MGRKRGKNYRGRGVEVERDTVSFCMAVVVRCEFYFAEDLLKGTRNNRFHGAECVSESELTM